jgi:hypothetical protein
MFHFCACIEILSALCSWDKRTRQRLPFSIILVRLWEFYSFRNAPVILFLTGASYSCFIILFYEFIGDSQRETNHFRVLIANEF